MIIKLDSNQKNVLLIFLISLLLCVIGSGAYPIYILDEAKNSEAAREMLINFDFIIPTFNNILRTDKPPLHYYFMILGYKLFGINALGARFFSGVFGAFTISTGFHFTNKFSGKTIAWITTIIMWSSVFFIQEFHLSVPDPYLIFFISSGLWLFYEFYNISSKKALWLMYISFALGTLVKGPVAIALPGLICLIFFISTKKLTFKKILSYQPILGLLVILAVTLPWYILVHLGTDGAWTKGFFLDHNINRFGNKMEGHGGVFLITWAFVLLGLMPFSLFAFYAFKKAYTKWKTNSLWLFGAIVSLVFILFFSISGTKLPNYTMPCYPFLALIIAKALASFNTSQKKNRHITIIVIIITLLAIALPIAGKIALDNEKELAEVSYIAFWLFPTAIITFIGAVLYFKNRFEKSFLFIASGWILVSPILFLIIYPKLTAQSPVSKAMPIIKKTKQITAYKRFDAAFPINFQRTFEIIKTKEEILSFFDRYPDGYIITNDRNHKELDTMQRLHKVFECKALFESHTTRIFGQSDLVN